jgi:hypothetical protein
MRQQFFNLLQTNTAAASTVIYLGGVSPKSSSISVVPNSTSILVSKKLKDNKVKESSNNLKRMNNSVNPLSPYLNDETNPFLENTKSDEKIIKEMFNNKKPEEISDLLKNFIELANQETPIVETIELEETSKNRKRSLKTISSRSSLRHTKKSIS